MTVRLFYTDTGVGPVAQQVEVAGAQKARHAPGRPRVEPARIP